MEALTRRPGRAARRRRRRGAARLLLFEFGDGGAYYSTHGRPVLGGGRSFTSARIANKLRSSSSSFSRSISSSFFHSSWASSISSLSRSRSVAERTAARACAARVGARALARPPSSARSGRAVAPRHLTVVAFSDRSDRYDASLI